MTRAIIFGAPFKLASDCCKPNGQYVVTPAMGAAFVEALPVGKFHGVGPVTADKMKRVGIFTGADLRRQTLTFLQQHFGKSGPWFHAISNGEDHRPHHAHHRLAASMHMDVPPEVPT